MSESSGFVSVLFPQDVVDVPLAESEPGYFKDLHLDQLILQLCRGRSLERLQPLFWTPLTTVAAIQYRQDVIREVEDSSTAQLIARFVAGFGQVLQQLSPDPPALIS